MTKLAGVVVLLVFKLSALESLLSSTIATTGRLASVLNGFVTLILSQSLFNLLATGALVAAGADGTEFDITVVGGGDGVVVATATVGTAVATVLETATLFAAFAIELMRVETWAGAVVAVAAMFVLIEEIFI